MTRVVVDADYLVYAAGFAVEKTRYDVSSLRPDGEYGETIVDSKTEADLWTSDEPEGSVVQVDKVVDAEPLGHALFLVNRILQGVDTNLTQAGVEFERLELFITGGDNFRNELSTIKGYKANRDPSLKPFHYKSLRRFLKNRWNAAEVNGIEADDAVAMAAHAVQYDPERLVIVSIDKDLLTIPGRHYHFKTKKMRDVTEQEALVYFYRQLITGDTVDNIGGAYKAGAKIAEANISETMSESAMYRVTLELYRKGLGYKGCPYAHMTAEDALLENARLLHLLRYPGDVWIPPGPARDAVPTVKDVLRSLTGQDLRSTSGPV